ncbi:sigma-70 family RNA polymerase sigma factor [Spirosoma sp. HMF4905]|uniref:Sigma-70 family RNA polymerase sigma factor n=1 Tax=Spirosoma arboris TaxID=2682092 RepID=A0A7K1SPK6_9BACT|nr:RNA polymerase sigma factor [Spirosoma arboris]MVM35729.1 sigma-70 family RNA polymerase sigma factor [Spirosoma arboris]
MNGVTKSFWEATYKQNIAKLIGVCYRYTYNRQIAEDLAHDAFLVAIDKSSSFENKGSFDAWLRRIVINVALQYLREQKKQKHQEDRIAYDTTSIDYQDENQVNEENTFSKAELLEAIERLPEHHKLVFNLYVFDNFTHAQIGAELGISEGTSKSHLARARKKIRQILNEKVNENKKRTRLFLLFLLPDKLYKIDHLFARQLNYFEIQPQKLFPFHTIDFSEISTLKSKPSAIFSEAYLKIDIAAVAIVMNVAAVLFLRFNSYKEIKSPVEVVRSTVVPGKLVELNSEKNTDKKFSTIDPITATISNTGIISSERTNNSETMKTINTLGALLLTSSTLAFDTTSLLSNYQLPTQLKNQKITERNIAETTGPIELIKSNAGIDSPGTSGTFYASELFWSAATNELYFKGRDVKINFNSNKFTGSGTFSFLNKISYLVINGTPVTLNETIKLSDKKYNLVKLTQEETVKKYGDKGNFGAVEITLAE